MNRSVKLLFYCVLVFRFHTLASNNPFHSIFKACALKQGIRSDAIVEQISNPELYEKLNYQLNLRPAKVYPWAYFLPKSTKDVQIAVACGREADVPLVPKSGGHSDESYSSGNASTLVIDFQKMAAIQVNSKHGMAKIGPGALLGTIYGKLWSKEFGLPMSTSLKLGLGGHALGGGYGVFLERFGLLLDHVEEMTMVDAEGEIHPVAKNVHPDLFWALRGVGSGYIGIVTSFKFRLIRAAGLRISFVRITYPMEDIVQVMKAWQTWLLWKRTYEPTVSSSLNILGGSGSGAIEVTSNYISEGEDISGSARFYGTISGIFPSTGTFKKMSLNFIQLVQETSSPRTAGNTSWQEIGLENTVEKADYTKSKSFFVSKTASPGELTRFAKLIKDVTHDGVSFHLHSFGGVVHDVPSTATAFVHRSSLYLVGFSCSGLSCTVDGETRLRKIADETRFMDNGESYQNCVDNDLRYTYLNRFYGRNVPKLLRIKKKYDPSNYFQNPESLPVIY